MTFRCGLWCVRRDVIVNVLWVTCQSHVESKAVAELGNFQVFGEPPPMIKAESGKKVAVAVSFTVLLSHAW